MSPCFVLLSKSRFLKIYSVLNRMIIFSVKYRKIYLPFERKEKGTSMVYKYKEHYQNMTRQYFSVRFSFIKKGTKRHISCESSNYGWWYITTATCRFLQDTVYSERVKEQCLYKRQTTFTIWGHNSMSFKIFPTGVKMPHLIKEINCCIWP